MDDDLINRSGPLDSGRPTSANPVLAIRDRIRKFHTDSTQTGGRKHALCVAPANPKTNKYL